MAEITYTEAELQALLAEVDAELQPVMKAEAAKLLAKAGEEPPPEETAGEGSPSGPPSPEASGSAPPSAPPSPEGPPVSPESAPPSPESASPDQGGGFPTDPAQLAEMVQQLPPEQQDALYLAAKQAIFSRSAQGPSAPSPMDAAAGAPPSPAGAPPSAPPSAPPGPPMPPPAMKAEMKPSPGNGKVMKSESEVKLEKLLEEQGKQLGLLEKAVRHLVTTPLRKAATSVPHVQKGDASEQRPLSKSELTAKLKSKAQDPSLAKKDREAINKFYNSGSYDLTLVQHLLAE